MQLWNVRGSGEPVRLKTYMTIENWYCHRLELPGHHRVCDAFEQWVMRA